MLHSLVIFLVTAAISFGGSLQLGPVNLTVIQTTITRNRRAAMIIGLGGSIPELLYSIPALFASAWVKTNAKLLVIFEWAIVPVLLTVGLMNLLKKSKPMAITEEKTLKQHTADFFRGFLLAMFNPQLFPYWVTILLLLNGHAFFHIESTADKCAFVLGTGIGAFFLFLFWGWLATRYKTFLVTQLSRWKINRVFGILFLGLAAYQAIRLFLS